MTRPPVPDDEAREYEAEVARDLLCRFAAALSGKDANTPVCAIGDNMTHASGDPLADWPAFVERAGRRLANGRQTYGDRSFRRPPRELVREIEEELLDVAAWSYILWHRVRALREEVGA